MKFHFKRINSSNYQIIIFHGLTGLLVGYFILHPVSMAIHWYEQSQAAFNLSNAWSMLSENMIHSFAFQMAPMAVAFAVLGLVIGIASGLNAKSLKNKQNRLNIKRQLLQQSIPTLIAKGENEYVEFRASLRHDYRQVKTDKSIEHEVLRSIAGFLNGKGGLLILGVSKGSEVLGLNRDYWTLKKDNREGFQQRLMLLISNTFGKDMSSRIHISFHLLGAKEVCLVLIEPAPRPVYLKEGNNTNFYLRTGNVTNQLNTSETVEYLQSIKTI